MHDVRTRLVPCGESREPIISKQNVSRRKFLTEASAGTVAAVTTGAIRVSGNVIKKADTLAVLGQGTEDVPVCRLDGAIVDHGEDAGIVHLHW